jgi:hypothetical protein
MSLSRGGHARRTQRFANANMNVVKSARGSQSDGEGVCGLHRRVNFNTLYYMNLSREKYEYRSRGSLW